MGSLARAVQLFMETQNRSKFLFLRNCVRKAASHFSWNCSKQPPRRRARNRRGRGSGSGGRRENR
ncbi:hypothetical protein GFL49_00740 [Rhizobium leguminosarum bv. viciae]|nr:hypothetical protein [Rhizobium leguminosarum bv. viciae]